MNNNINPVVAVIIIVVVVVIAVGIGWKTLGPRRDGPTKPVNMAEMMGKQQIAPPASAHR